jgi:hypothetical protein
MKIRLANGGTASPDDLAALQKMMRRPLPDDYLAFVEHHDGARPESNIFDVGPDDQSGVHEFIPVREIPRAMSHVEDLPSDSFPFAWDACGNCLFVDLGAGGTIFFWDHEVPDGIIKVADGFQQFVDGLQPFDPATVPLDPGRVVEAWIDPDFLQSLDPKHRKKP